MDIPKTEERARKPVSRIDSNNTHGWLARVYRSEWVGSRSFADQKYGGRAQAEANAYRWVRIADERLPQIPPKPVLWKATIHLRRDRKNPALSYYDVYLGTGRSTNPTKRFYFPSPAQARIYRRKSESRTLDYYAEDIYRRIGGVETIDFTDRQEAARQKADALKNQVNERLQIEYENALAVWYVEHDRILDEIARLWPEIKTMPV